MAMCRPPAVSSARILKYRVRTTDGNWRQKTETVYDMGIREAKSLVQQRVRDASALPVQPTDQTVLNFVENTWRPYLERTGVKPSTQQSYESNLNRHILPTFGAMLLVDVAPIHVDEWLQSKTKLSPKTVRNLVVLLHSIFSLALEYDLIARSPIKKKHKPRVHRHEKTMWSPEQVRQILGAVPQQFTALFVCIALTGVRFGELLGLRWGDINFANRRISIKNSLWHGKLVPPKTEGSVRAIPMGTKLEKVLRQHRDATLSVAPDAFVFSKSDGMPLNPDVLRKDVLYPVLDRLRIERPKRGSGFHAFRHTAASLLNAETGNLRLTQKLLGHSNANTTEIYTHTTNEIEEAAAVD